MIQQVQVKLRDEQGNVCQVVMDSNDRRIRLSLPDSVFVTVTFQKGVLDLLVLDPENVLQRNTPVVVKVSR